MSGLAVAFAVRLLYSLLIPDAIAHFRDSLSYDSIAKNLIAGVGFRDTTGEWPGEPPYADPSAPTARWLPGYPLLVAGVYLIFRESYRAVYVMQAVLGVAVAALIYLLGKEAVNSRAGVAAVWLYALDPFSIYLVGMYQTELLFTLLLTASLYCFYRTARDGPGRTVFAILFGLSAGVASLTRNVAAPAFGLLCLAIACGSTIGSGMRSMKVRVTTLALATTLFLFSVAPWLARNYRLTGQFVFSTQVWQAIAMGNNNVGGLRFRGVGGMPPTFIEQREVQRELIYKTFGIDWIKRNPWRFAELCGARMLAFWSPLAGFTTGGKAILTILFNAIVYIPALIYVVHCRARWRTLLPMFLTMLAFTLTYGVAVISTRFRLPMYPLLEVLAAGGIQLLGLRYLPAVER